MASPLAPVRYHALADALGDTPETAIPVHLLRRRLCQAWVVGGLPDFVAAVIQSASLKDEPWVFGGNPDMAWRVLDNIPGWARANVGQPLARPLGAVIERETGAKVRHYGDVYHTLTGAATAFSNKEVRQLGLPDRSLVAEYRKDPRGSGFASIDELLTQGIVAAAIVDGILVAMAHTSAVTERHADIGVSTLEPWRRRGFATSAASIVARRVQQTGRIPVWSAGEDNFASLRVAQKLGFAEVSRRMYISTVDVE